MNVKKIVSIGVALAIIGTGCSSGKTASSSNRDTGTTQGSSSPASPYKTKIDLKFFVQGPNDSVLPQGDADFVKKTIEQKFNVSLDMKYMAFGADRTNKLNMLLASGDAPDVFTSPGLDSQKYILDKLTADLTPYITPQTMPNYYKLVGEDVVKRFQIEKVFQRTPAVFAKDVYRSYYIRKDWLDKLGLQIPKTYDEMMEVMRKFTNNDPDGNGKKDTYGMSTIGNGNSVSMDFPQFIHNGLIGAFMIRDNHLVDVQSDPKMENVLNEIKGMLKEGIVDPDWFLNKGTMHIDKAVQGKVGIVVGGTKTFAFDSDPTSLQNKAKALNPKADWEPFNPFASTGVWTENLPDTALMISKKAESDPEKMKRIAAILDWLCSEEGYVLTHYGREGKEYTRSGKTLTLKPDVYQKEIVEKGNFLAPYSFMTYNVDEPDRFGLEVIDPRMTDRDRNILKTIKSYKLIPSIGTNVAPPTGFNLGDFRAKMREYQVKILFDEPDASNWPKYREELMTKLGGQKMLDTYEEQIRAVGVIK